MTTFPVLDDCTKDAAIIGYAATAAEAAAVFAAKMIEWHGADHGLTAPAIFAHRDPDSLSEDVRAQCPQGAFEPAFA